jgi:hypothetical protein
MKIITNIPELSQKERKLPLSKYYDFPLHTMGPLYQQIIDNGPIDPKDALKVENWLDHLQLPGDYDEKVFGYCVMDDGCGYIASYCTYPDATPEMMKWYFHWLNIYSKNQPVAQEICDIRFGCRLITILMAISTERTDLTVFTQ